jgi:hypothetical protein
VSRAQIEKSEGKHPTEFGEAIFAPFFPGVYEDFSVGLRGEAVAAQLQRVAELAVVVKFTIEDYGDVAFFVPDGLMAAGQIDDAEAAHSESEAGSARFVEEEAFFIGATMEKRGGHGPNTGLRTRMILSECGAADATHLFF